MPIYWPTPGFKGRTFKLCVLNRWDFNFCVLSSPLRVTTRCIRLTGQLMTSWLGHVSCPFPSASHPASKWHKLSELVVWFSVFMRYVAWKRGLPRNLHVLSCFIRIKSVLFNLWCVLDHCFRRRRKKEKKLDRLAESGKRKGFTDWGWDGSFYWISAGISG